jgi:PGF-CTERM protein
MKNITKAVILAVVVLSIFAIASTTALKPIQQVSPYNMTTTAGVNTAGGITGRVTTFNTTIGIANTDVWIVNSSNTSQYFWHTTTNAQGFFQLTNINNTYVDAAWVGLNNAWTPTGPGLGTFPGYMNLYKAYCNDSTFGEGYSNNFSVESNSNAWAAIIINPVPAHIKIYTERTSIVVDGEDKIKVWAYVTDALNNPVADNTPIRFTFSNVTLSYFDGVAGTYIVGGSNVGNITTVGTTGGYANLSYGIIPEGFAGNNTTLKAAWALSPSVNDSIKVYFNPTVVSWFGSVVDTYGNAQGGVPVVLHVGNLTGGVFNEIYTLNQTTLPDKPYPGTYVFDNIIMWSNVTTAYASAQWTIQDNVVITGKSDWYSLNKSRTSAGFIVLHVPLPDAIKVSPNPDLILVGGDTSVITAQLYLNGNPYRRPNVPITFFGDNDTRAYLPTVKTNLSDANGAATILLTSNMSKGIVNITAFSQVTVVNNLTDTCQVTVVGWGTISGMVTDKNKNGVPNATVKLWRTTSNDSGVWSTTLYPSPENPQQTVSRPEVAAIGTYTYYRIPSGIYNVTAEKADASGNNHIWFAIVNLTVGTATNNVAIPDLVIATPPVATPVVTAVPATPTPVVTAAPTAIPTPTPSPGFETVFALAGLLGVAYLIARKEH